MEQGDLLLELRHLLCARAQQARQQLCSESNPPPPTRAESASSAPLVSRFPAAEAASDTSERSWRELHRRSCSRPLISASLSQPLSPCLLLAPWPSACSSARVRTLRRATETEEVSLRAELLFHQLDRRLHFPCSSIKPQPSDLTWTESFQRERQTKM